MQLYTKLQLVSFYMRYVFIPMFGLVSRFVSWVSPPLPQTAAALGLIS